MQVSFDNQLCHLVPLIAITCVRGRSDWELAPNPSYSLQHLFRLVMETQCSGQYVTKLEQQLYL